MPTRAIRSAAFTLFAAGALLATPAGAEPLEPAELKAKLAALSGKAAEVEGKFLECWGDRYVSLVGSDLKFYLPASGPLKKQVPNNKDSAGLALKNKNSNVLLKGLVVDNRARRFPQRDAYFFELRELRRLVDDIPRFEDKLAAVKSGDHRGIHAVARAARSWAERYGNQDLKEWARDRDLQGLKAHEAQLAGAGLDQWIALAREYVSKLGDKAGAIAVLDKVYRAEGRSAEELRRLRAELKALGAYYYGARWVTYAQYKSDEGFIQRTIEGKLVWITQKRAELLDQIAKHQSSATEIVALDAEYENSAASGKTTKGMRRFHLAALKNNNSTLGFPKFVDRLRIKRPGRKEPSVYDQWIFSNNRRYYFHNDRLFAWFIDNEPYPSK